MDLSCRKTTKVLVSHNPKVVSGYVLSRLLFIFLGVDIMWFVVDGHGSIGLCSSKVVYFLAFV